MFWACFRPLDACPQSLELLANIGLLGCLPFSASFLEKSAYTQTACRSTVCSGLVLGRLLHVRGPLELLANIALLGCLVFSASFLEKSVYTQTD
jgi:hypothetical protein